MLIELQKNSPVYECFSYPGGELQVRFRSNAAASVLEAKAVTVLARITSPSDIIELALLRDAIGFNKKCRLVLPYLPYARADRRFVDGDCHGLLVFCRLLFAMSWDKIVCLDVHNHKETNACGHITDVSPSVFIEQSIVRFAKNCVSDFVTVLLPDAGAAARYLIQNDVMGVQVMVRYCDKIRDAATGKLTGFSVPLLPDGPVMIVDDICDGGGTFLGIAEKIDKYRPLGLYTTHGLYSKGTMPLSRFALFTTNSFKLDYPGVVNVFDCIPTMLAG